MKRQFILGVMIILMPVMMLAQGSTYKFGTTVRVNESDSISSNVMAAGQFVDIFGYLNDDLFSASRNLVINGSVNDDAIVAARTVTVRGSIGDMLMAAGETVVIDGNIAGDLFAVGSEIRIAPNATINGNVAVAGNDIIFEGGNINGWLRAAGNEISLNGTVNSYVELYGESYYFGENYRPASSTTITADHEIDPTELGNPPEDLNVVMAEEEGWVAGILVSVLFFLSLFITGVLLILIFRQTTIDLQRFSIERFFKNTGIGFIMFLVIPITIVVLFILILTIPMAVMLMMVFGLALIIGYLLVALILGTVSIRYFKSGEDFSDYFWGLALGMILILILTTIPYAGGIINLLLIFFGLGTLISYFWKLRVNSV